MFRNSDTYTTQMDQYFLQHVKLTDTCTLYFVILKDVLHNISVTMKPSEVFSMEKKDVYTIGKLFRPDMDQNDKKLIRIVESRFEDILNTANRKYNKWTELKTKVENFKPTFRVFWSDCVEPCRNMTQYKYGRNDCIDASCIGFFYDSLIWGPLFMIIVGILSLILYPILAIYDCVSGRNANLRNRVQTQLNNGEYIPTERIDSSIEESLQNLVVEMSKQVSSNIIVQSGSNTLKYTVTHTSSESDYEVQHTADRCYLQFMMKPNNVAESNVKNDDIAIIV